MKWRPLIRLLVFMAVAGLFAVMELTTLTGPHTGTTDDYSAMFGGTDGVSGLRDGNPVRVAGVAGRQGHRRRRSSTPGTRR